MYPKATVLTYLEKKLTQYFNYLERKGKAFNVSIGMVCAITVGVIDIMAPNVYNFGFFYLLVIAFTTWFAGKHAGLIMAAGCTALWSVDRFSVDKFAYTWNMLSALGIFCIGSILLTRIRNMLETESNHSRIDPLTGVMNIRAFTELAEYEILRSQRGYSPFSIAYLDIDDFKKTNDLYGHSKGNELLNAVITCIAHNVRKTDIIARMGGDEFAVLFPATDLESVKVVTQKVMKELNNLSEVNNWFISISMGVVVCADGACEFEDLIAAADKLMYEVKNAGKNNVLYALYPVDGNNCHSSSGVKTTFN